MSNDWAIVPNCGIELNGDEGTGRADAPHSVVWEFPDKKTATEFAVFVETMHGKLDGKSDDQTMMVALAATAMRLSVCVARAKKYLEAVAADAPPPYALYIHEALKQIDPANIKL